MVNSTRFYCSVYEHVSNSQQWNMWIHVAIHYSCNISRRRIGNGCISTGCQSPDDISTVLLDYCESLLYAASSMQIRYCEPDYVRFIVADINPICSYNRINTWIYSFEFRLSVNNIPNVFRFHYSILLD